MAFNQLYIPYSIMLLIVLIFIGFIIRKRLGRKSTKVFLIISIPVFAFFQIYFWNSDFNDYIKSYLFPSKSFVCEDYNEEDKNTAIPLPKRTVFQGKSDGCSPFYITYIDDEYFLKFYQEELHTMKNNGEIQSYNYVKQGDKNRFEVTLSSGTNVDIFREYK